jgi:hypothetical protein
METACDASTSASPSLYRILSLDEDLGIPASGFLS